MNEETKKKLIEGRKEILRARFQIWLWNRRAQKKNSIKPPETPSEAPKVAEPTVATTEGETIPPAPTTLTLEAKKPIKGKRIVIDTIKRKGRKFDVVKKADGTWILESVNKIKGKPITVLPYSFEKLEKHTKQSEASRKAYRTRTEGKTIIKENQITPAMDCIRKAGNYKGTANFFKDILVQDKNALRPFVKDTDIDNRDSAVEAYNEYVEKTNLSRKAVMSKKTLK